MSERPPNPGADDVDDHYRRASALDASRPSESVRHAVLAHAAQCAEERAAEHIAAKNETAENEAMPARMAAARRAANQTWRRPAIFGTLAAAALAGLLIVPQFLPLHAPGTATVSKSAATRLGADAERAPSAPPPAPESAAQPAAAQAKSTAGARTASLQNLSEARRQRDVQRPSAADFVPEPAAPQVAVSAQAVAPRASGLAQTPASLIAGHLDEPPAALRRAAEAGDVGVIQGLLEQHAAVDGRDASGRTALMLATLHGRVAVVDALLKAGADPNAADANGVTPLQAAVAGNRPQIEAALRRAGAR